MYFYSRIYACNMFNCAGWTSTLFGANDRPLASSTWLTSGSINMFVLKDPFLRSVKLLFCNDTEEVSPQDPAQGDRQSRYTHKDIYYILNKNGGFVIRWGGVHRGGEWGGYKRPW